MTTLPVDWPNRDASGFVRAGTLDWHVQSMGNADAPVALLLHGTGAATHSWRDVMPLLIRHFRVIAPDLPGHGYTRGKLSGGLSLAAVAQSVVALTTALDVRPSLIVGHSAGAAIALRIALDGKIVPDAIVGIAPALLPFPGIAQDLFPAMARLLFVNPFAPHIAAQIARRPGAVGRFLARSTGSRIDLAGVDGYATVFASAQHCAGALGMMADWDLVGLKSRLPELRSPLLVLHGDRDAAIPLAAARKSVALVPGARLSVLGGLGHLAHEESPDDVAARIFDFAREQSIIA